MRTCGFRHTLQFYLVVLDDTNQHQLVSVQIFYTFMSTKLAFNWGGNSVVYTTNTTNTLTTPIFSLFVSTVEWLFPREFLGVLVRVLYCTYENAAELENRAHYGRDCRERLEGELGGIMWASIDYFMYM